MSSSKPALFCLVPVEMDGSPSKSFDIVLLHGENTLGRAHARQDKHVSPKQVALVVNDDKLTITALGKHPMCIRRYQAKDREFLQRGQQSELKHGDGFTLLFDRYLYVVIRADPGKVDDYFEPRLNNIETIDLMNEDRNDMKVEELTSQRLFENFDYVKTSSSLGQKRLFHESINPNDHQGPPRKVKVVDPEQQASTRIQSKSTDMDKSIQHFQNVLDDTKDLSDSADDFLRSITDTYMPSGSSKMDGIVSPKKTSDESTSSSSTFSSLPSTCDIKSKSNTSSSASSSNTLFKTTNSSGNISLSHPSAPSQNPSRSHYQMNNFRQQFLSQPTPSSTRLPQIGKSVTGFKPQIPPAVVPATNRPRQFIEDSDDDVDNNQMPRKDDIEDFSDEEDGRYSKFQLERSLASISDAETHKDRASHQHWNGR